MNDDVAEVILTGPSADWIAEFTRGLVDDRLAACGHLSGTIRSIYRWRDTVHDEPEARVALHTRTDLVARIVERANAEHPYEVPCVIALPIVDGSPAYCQWIREQTATEQPD